MCYNKMTKNSQRGNDVKKIFKLFITLLLAFALAFNAVSCETLENLNLDEIKQLISEYVPGNNDDTPVVENPGDNFGGTEVPGEPSGNEPGGNEPNGNEPGGNGNGGIEVQKPYLDPDFYGGVIYLPAEDDPVTSDPYVNVNVEEFYANYTPAISYMDSYYRTQHNLMSGAIGEQDQAPTISEYQPELGGKLVRNTSYIYSADGNTYYVVDAYGNIVNKIFRGGAYIMLEEVAAHMFAFGELPANHSTSKSTKPTSSPWGEFLRLNHSKFSGSTTNYPYEPMLPDISGCGGALQYYEMDVGTMGTDCDPNYDITVYNNGSKITRGAARIVYTRYDKDGDGVIEIGETYLFYTYNHYNDFQEYLNYEGGWGEMFGNVTGGGTLSSKTDYNPTPYVEVAYVSLVNSDGSSATKYMTEIIVMWIPKREEA